MDVRARRDSVGVLALLMLNLLALAYDSQWLFVAVGLDAAVVGAYLRVTSSGSNTLEKGGKTE